MISRRLEDEVEIALLGKAISKLTKREQMIIRLRFGIGNREGSEKTQKEVADLLGIFAILHFPSGKADHEAAAERNRKV